MERALGWLVTIPVGIGLLDDDLAFLEDPLEHHVDVEVVVAGILGPDCHVLVVAENRKVRCALAFEAHVPPLHGEKGEVYGSHREPDCIRYRQPTCLSNDNERK